MRDLPNQYHHVREINTVPVIGLSSGVTVIAAGDSSSLAIQMAAYIPEEKTTMLNPGVEQLQIGCHWSE